MFRGGKVPGYKSPINVEFVSDFAKQLVTAEDAAIMGEIRMHVDVDKDELLKALAYDRSQYSKGYSEGYDKGFLDGRDAALDAIKAVVESMAKEDEGKV